jgi:hypothetical protein
VDKHSGVVLKMGRLSKATLALLAPLPPVSSFGNAVNDCTDRAEKDHDGVVKRSCDSSAASPATSKRQKLPEGVHAVNTRVPPDVSLAIDAIRREGAPADTLFFPSVPPDLREECALRAAIAAPLRELKILPQTKPGAKVLAWASFFNEADCVSALCTFRRTRPNLKPRLHKPKAGGGSSGPAATAATPLPLEVFNARADKIVSDGGLADTIMLRGLPLDVSEVEILDMMLNIPVPKQPLKTRTSEGNSGNVRNFWISFSSRSDAAEAFTALMGYQASFRCGKAMRIVPVVHNDSKDADAKKRRHRELAMGTHASIGDRDRVRLADSTTRGEPDSPHPQQDSMNRVEKLERLANLLKVQSNTFTFA